MSARALMWTDVRTAIHQRYGGPIADFTAAYADQSELDSNTPTKAVQSRYVEARTGL